MSGFLVHLDTRRGSFFLDTRTLPEVKYDPDKPAMLAVTSRCVAGDGARLDLPGCHATRSLAHSVSHSPARSFTLSVSIQKLLMSIFFFLFSRVKKSSSDANAFFFSEYCDYFFGLYQSNEEMSIGQT